MFRRILRLTLVQVIALQLVSLGFVATPQAGVVSTETLLQIEQRAEHRNQVDRFLMRQDVRDEMIQLGVAPEVVQARLAMLTDREIEALAMRIDSLPAGGNVVAVIGVVFIVLIVLELVGATNLFTKL